MRNREEARSGSKGEKVWFMTEERREERQEEKRGEGRSSGGEVW